VPVRHKGVKAFRRHIHPRSELPPSSRPAKRAARNMPFTYIESSPERVWEAITDPRRRHLPGRLGGMAWGR
jgi:hypothetical protein